MVRVALGEYWILLFEFIQIIQSSKSIYIFQWNFHRIINDNFIRYMRASVSACKIHSLMPARNRRSKYWKIIVNSKWNWGKCIMVCRSFVHIGDKRQNIIEYHSSTYLLKIKMITCLEYWLKWKGVDSLARCILL